ncbi:MAG: arsenate reductase ArsC [Bacteroidetes bacterium]|nr:arsenate reductase ArsC [Bacteroidota bacterium]
MEKKRILVLCTGNSCRSQIAHGYLENFGTDLFEVRSAGIEAHGVNPRAIQTMLEDGIDISNHTSNLISDYEGEPFDYVITVCDHAKEVCPWFPAKAAMLHHNFPDPAKASGTEEQVMEAFRNVREEIKTYCREFTNKFRENAGQ